jgi:hypothetical protein
MEKTYTNLFNKWKLYVKMNKYYQDINEKANYVRRLFLHKKCMDSLKANYAKRFKK